MHMIAMEFCLPSVATGVVDRDESVVSFFEVRPVCMKKKKSNSIELIRKIDSPVRTVFSLNLRQSFYSYPNLEFDHES